MPEPRRYPEGVTAWVDIEQPDAEASKAFYGGLLGWTFIDAAPPDAPFRYVIAQLEGQDAAGIGGPADPDQPTSGPPLWNTYVAVDDADAVAARVEAAGGQVLDAPSDAGEGGRSAACADPTGVPFRLWQARRRLGAQVLNTPGAWNFSNLHTPDREVAEEFYAAVFGWSIDDLGFAIMIRRPGYGDHLAATVDPGIHERQSGVSAPPGFVDAIGWLVETADRDAGWQVTFTVGDRDACAAEAERLGGTVLSRGDSNWDRSAVIRDPQGGVFTASQFTPPE